MEDLSRLRRKHAAYRTYVLKTLKSVDDLLQDYNASKKGKLKAFRDVLNDKLEVLSELNTSILDQVESDEIDKETEETSDLKGDIQERIVNIDLVIRSSLIVQAAKAKMKVDLPTRLQVSVRPRNRVQRKRM